MENMHYWIWLSLAVTPGSESFKKLITKFESVENIYNADEQDLAFCIGSRSRDFKALSDKNLDRAKEIYDFCTSKSVGILTYRDERYPNSLREIANPPVLLYFRGILPDFNNGCFVSVVGTRRLTEYGKRNAFSISYDLSRSGFTIVSGMAIGVDGVAAAGALSAGGVTVAFLGSGIDVCYPPQHLKLAKEIVKTGCIMTEYAPGTKPDGWNFPRRNRLISGISSATVVIEGNLNSGAIITARCAKLQNKALYALPGNVDNKTSAVTNLLIKNGAKLITDATDVIKDFEFVYLGKINPFKISEPSEIHIGDAIAKYSVCCVTPSDRVFKPSKAQKTGKNGESIDELIAKERTVNLPKIEAGFDKKALSIYKKIPVDGECSIEFLTDEENSMRDVMKALLKLEMGRYVVMLPGEKVKRNL